MTVSTLEVMRVRQSVCPHCGEPVGSGSQWIERGLGILAIVALALMLVPLGFIAWKSFASFVSDKDSHSILFQPLEDWTRY